MEEGIMGTNGNGEHIIKKEKEKNKQMGLYQTKKLLHSKDHQQ